MTLRVDIGEDKNVFVDDGSSRRQKMQSSVLMDDTSKSSDEALIEAKHQTWPFWINSEPLLMGIENFEGEVSLYPISDSINDKMILIDVWNYTIPNSIRSLDYLKEWNRRYLSAGLVIVGVHTPFFEINKTTELIVEAVKQLGITYPVVIDNDLLIWKSLENRYWPRRVLINSKKEILYDVIGEGEYTELEKTIQEALRLQSPGLACPPLMKSLYTLDDKGFEVLLGSKKSMPLGNPSLSAPESLEQLFKDNPDQPKTPGLVYFDGSWIFQSESVHLPVPATSTVAPITSRLTLGFEGTGIYIVAKSKAKLQGDMAKPVKAYIQIDGRSVTEDFRGKDLFGGDGRPSQVEVKTPNLYHLVRKLPQGKHELTITTDNAGSGLFELFAIFVEGSTTEI